MLSDDYCAIVSLLGGNGLCHNYNGSCKKTIIINNWGI